MASIDAETRRSEN